MKSVATKSVLLLVFIGSAQSWLVPALQRAGAAAVLAAATWTASPLAAPAATDYFTGSYADPNHPNCLRNVQVAPSGTTAQVSGTDGTPGCPPDGSGRPWSLEGKVDGATILVDFSPKGGPPGLKGLWDETAPMGIKWPDGNKWTRKS